MKLKDLHDVLVDELRDLYHAEKQIIRALPKMVKAAHAPELQSALEEHLAVTETQAKRLEKCFEELGMTARAKTCHGIEGILEEGKEILENGKDGNPDAMDAAMIAAAQKVEHYEIAAYGSCRTHAETLGLSRIAKLLQETLDEEGEADKKLSQIAESKVNAQASADGKQ